MLDYSIRKHASVPVRVIPMVDFAVPRPRDQRNRPRTGFSFSRFLIPALAGHRGRAVYMDSDMLVFGDVAELAEVPLDPHQVLCTYQEAPPEVWADNPSFHPGRHSAVMVIDCARAPGASRRSWPASIGATSAMKSSWPTCASTTATSGCCPPSGTIWSISSQE